MKRLAWLLTVVVPIAAIFFLARFLPQRPRAANIIAPPPAPIVDPHALSVVTINLGAAEPQNQGIIAARRQRLLLNILYRRQPDIVAMQACLPAQAAFFAHYLPYDNHYPPAARPGLNLLNSLSQALETWNQIFYRKDRFTAVTGSFGLVRPHHLAANATENTYYSMVLLRDRKHILPDIIVADVHLRHGIPGAIAAAVRMQQRIRALWSRYPSAQVIFLGDMNHPKTITRLYANLLGAQFGDGPHGSLVDAFDYAARPHGVLWGTWQDFVGKPVLKLPTDLIFLSRGWHYTPAQIWRDHLANGLYPSDHYPVAADLQWKPAP